MEEIQKDIEIDENILLDAGFKEFESKNQNKELIYTKYYDKNVNDEFFITINNEINNDGLWYVQIDNKYHMSIGGLDISNIWQFNKLMEIIGCDFEL